MFNVRQTTLSDLDSLTKLRLDLLREVGNLKDDDDALALAQANRQYFAAKIPSGEFVAWVAEVDGQIVAISGLVFFERPPIANNLSGLEGYILNMYTVPEWRGGGLATALLKEIISFAKNAGVRRLWLHATPAGKPLYEKAGFIPRPAAARSSATAEMELVW
ncbi:MAG: GNAT family N-acetyltransferase [Chloroflexota bacterium]|nr:GNAT family N-acetyltransferase [Chloroflexota bacterium]